jgi:hypothetical protein
MHTPFLPSKPRAVLTALTVSAVQVAVGRARIEPLPMDDWPTWAKDIAKDRLPADMGVGDTVMHMIGDTRSEKFKTFWKETVGTGCGCSERQGWLNQRFPYP